MLPGLKAAGLKRLVQTVKYVSGIAAAVMVSIPFGMGRHWTAGTAQYSA
jgi:hypothetical protein